MIQFSIEGQFPLEKTDRYCQICGDKQLVRMSRDQNCFFMPPEGLQLYVCLYVHRENTLIYVCIDVVRNRFDIFKNAICLHL